MPGVPGGNGQSQGALRGHFLLLLPGILQTHHPEGGPGAVQAGEEVQHSAPGEEVLSSLQI